jgi:ADP-heptose:LPS heptosyltransferase
MYEYESSEEEEQIALFRWISYAQNFLPELQLLYHIPNGGYRSTTEAKRFKAAGVKAGIPDLHLPVARVVNGKRYNSLYIELKVGKNTPSKQQKEVISKLKEAGNAVVVCYGSEQAQQALSEYLAGDKCL